MRGPVFNPDEQAQTGRRRRKQSAIEQSKMAAPQRHRQCVGRQRQRQQGVAQAVEANRCLRGMPPIGRQMAQGQPERQHAQRQIDQEDRPPSRPGDQRATQRRAQRGADRRHRAQPTHDASRPALRRRLAGEGHGQRHQYSGAQALRGARRHQDPEVRRRAAQDRRGGEQRQPRQHQPPPAQQIAQPAGAHDRGRDGKQIGQHHPLHRLKRHAERLRQRWQADIGDAGAQR